MRKLPVKVRLFAFAAGTIVCSVPLLAQEVKPTLTDDTRAYFEVLRSDFNADKIATINIQVL